MDKEVEEEGWGMLPCGGLGWGVLLYPLVGSFRVFAAIFGVFVFVLEQIRIQKSVNFCSDVRRC